MSAGGDGPAAVSLFSGAGGLDVGFERAGFATVLANEADRDAAAAWRANRPGNAGAMVEGDVRGLLGGLAALRGEVGVLFGGPPCQGFSVAGRMDPGDPRSALVWAFMDAAAAVRPRAFVIENVAALARLGRWAPVREGLAARAGELGYAMAWRVLRAWEHGVPQRRERVFFVGVREGEGDPDAVWPLLAARRAAPPPLRSALLSCGPYGSPSNPATCPARVTLAARPVLRRSPYAGMLVNGAGRPVDLDGLAPTLPATMGGNRTPVVDQAALEDPSRENWFAGYRRRLAAGLADPSREAVPASVRRLTLAEAAAVQTFPAGYAFAGPPAKAYRQVGNAVPCDLAEAVARAVREALFR